MSAGPNRTQGCAEPGRRAEDVVIAIDAMGGDRGVGAVVEGMAQALADNPTLRFVVHGDAAQLRTAMAAGGALGSGLGGGLGGALGARTEVRHAESVITMSDKPSKALRTAQGSSMWNALESVRTGESAVVISAGNTGALMALAMLRLRKAPEVDRPAIAVLWPSRSKAGYTVMLDAGADIRADARDLLNYALMGASYARHALGLARPRVGLLNVGTEEHKGRSELHEASDLIAAAGPEGDLDFIGYVEGSDIASDRVDVVVTDGFTGNVALKTGEGTASLIRDLLREAFGYSALSRTGALFAAPALRRLKDRIDPRRVNGGVFLGLNGTVIKSHGGADATGIAAAIRLGFTLAQGGFTERLAARIASGSGAASAAQVSSS